MTLSDAEVERYARQLVIPELGIEGQTRLLECRVAVFGDPAGVCQATTYLRASGVGTVVEEALPEVDLILIAGTEAVEPECLKDLFSLGPSVVWYAAGGEGFTTGFRSPGSVQPSPAGRRRELPGRSHQWKSGATHAVAACDASARTIAALLGWPGAGGPGEVVLG